MDGIVKRIAVGIPDVGAMAFSRWVGTREGGRTYALPTEAKWHYACRAGSSATFAWGDNPVDARTLLDSLGRGSGPG